MIPLIFLIQKPFLNLVLPVLKIKFRLVFLALLLSVSFSSNAAIISIGTTDDRTIGDTNSDQVGDSLLSQTDGYLRSGFYSTHWRSALEFDLATISPSSTILAADLFLRDRGASRDGTLNIWGYSGDGVIDVTDGSMTDTIVGTIDILSSVGQQDFNISITSFLQDLIDSGASYAGFLIGADTTTGFGGAASDICSGDIPNFCSNAGFPTLTVNFEVSQVPTPATVWLLGSAILGLIGYKRRA